MEPVVTAVLTVAKAIEILPMLFSLIGKAVTAMMTKDPVNIEEELAMLDSLKLRPKEDIIAEADLASGE